MVIMVKTSKTYTKNLVYTESIAKVKKEIIALNILQWDMNEYWQIKHRVDDEEENDKTTDIAKVVTTTISTSCFKKNVDNFKCGWKDQYARKFK